MNKPSIVYPGNCLDYLRTLEDDSIDAVVTDPPYGLGKEPDPREVLSAWLNDDEFKPGGKGFMGKAWDAFVPSPVVWAECYRVLKPGGHLLSFAGARTYDWIALGVRLAGFQVRDQIMWITGQGFPKSVNVSKAIDRALGAPSLAGQQPESVREWQGWGTALKPAHEPIVMARKPLIGTVAA